MIRRFGLFIALAGAQAALAEDVVIDFEQAEIGKPVPTWADKGVVFKLAGPLTQSKATGRVMFFPHLATGRKGVLNAMPNDQGVPLKMTFPGVGASSVTLVLWGSTGCPALLEALDKNGVVVDKASVPAVPGRKAPADAIPFFQLSVKAPEGSTIATIRFSGPRNGEFLAADEVRFTIDAN